jgi:hypothetical protein
MKIGIRSGSSDVVFDGLLRDQNSRTKRGSWEPRLGMARYDKDAGAAVQAMVARPVSGIGAGGITPPPVDLVIRGSVVALVGIDGITMVATVQDSLGGFTSLRALVPYPLQEHRYVEFRRQDMIQDGDAFSAEVAIPASELWPNPGWSGEWEGAYDNFVRNFNRGVYGDLAKYEIGLEEGFRDEIQVVWDKDGLYVLMDHVGATWVASRYAAQSLYPWSLEYYTGPNALNGTTGYPVIDQYALVGAGQQYAAGPYAWETKDGAVNGTYSGYSEYEVATTWNTANTDAFKRAKVTAARADRRTGRRHYAWSASQSFQRNQKTGTNPNDATGNQQVSSWCNPLYVGDGDYDRPIGIGRYGDFMNDASGATGSITIICKVASAWKRFSAEFYGSVAQDGDSSTNSTLAIFGDSGTPLLTSTSAEYGPCYGIIRRDGFGGTETRRVNDPANPASLVSGDGPGAIWREMSAGLQWDVYVAPPRGAGTQQGFSRMASVGIEFAWTKIYDRHLSDQRIIEIIRETEGMAPL